MVAQRACAAGPAAPAPTCVAGARNGPETGVDCGGGCPACADGVGCNRTTDCRSGACGGGTCLAEVGEPCGGDAECAAQSAATCGSTGVCSGARSCQLHPAGTLCLAASCTADLTGSQLARSCNGLGACLNAGTQACAPYTCDTGTGLCRTTCTVDANCQAGLVCGAGGVCT